MMSKRHGTYDDSKSSSAIKFHGTQGNLENIRSALSTYKREQATKSLYNPEYENHGRSGNALFTVRPSVEGNRQVDQGESTGKNIAGYILNRIVQNFVNGFLKDYKCRLAEIGAFCEGTSIYGA